MIAEHDPDALHIRHAGPLIRTYVKLIERSGILAHLGQPTSPNPSKGGRPARLGSYTVIGVLVCQLLLITLGKPVSDVNVFRLIWEDLKPKHLDALGMHDLRRIDNRAARIRRNPDLRISEYMRFQKFLDRMYTPIDDTPTSCHQRLTAGELDRARTARKDELQPAADLQLLLCNDVIAASVEPKLIAHSGDRSVDEHNVTTAVDHVRSRPETPNSATPLAHPNAHSKNYKGSNDISLTTIVAVGNAYGPAVPNLILAMSIAPVQGQHTPYGITALEECDRNFPDTPADGSIKKMYGDQAYTAGNGWMWTVTSMGYVFCGDIPDNFNSTYSLARSRPGTTTPEPLGITLWSGTLICPAIPRNELPTNHLQMLKDKDTDADDEVAREQLLRRYRAAVMPTLGAPEATHQRPPGRPANDAPEGDRIIRIRARCPARRGYAACALYPPSMRHPHLPLLLDNQQAAAMPRPLPAICGQQTITIDIPEQRAKSYMHMTVGDWEHNDQYNYNRSRHEEMHSDLKSRNYGGQALIHLAIRSRRNGQVALTIALYLAHRNLVATKDWRRRLDSNGGAPPPSPRIRQAQARQRLFARRLGYS